MTNYPLSSNQIASLWHEHAESLSLSQFTALVRQVERCHGIFSPSEHMHRELEKEIKYHSDRIHRAST